MGRGHRIYLWLYISFPVFILHVSSSLAENGHYRPTCEGAFLRSLRSQVRITYGGTRSYIPGQLIVWPQALPEASSYVTLDRLCLDSERPTLLLNFHCTCTRTGILRVASSLGHHYGTLLSHQLTAWSPCI
jgi:hypothetical protein